MDPRVRISLRPADETVEVAQGTPLGDFLFPRGVEFPCGGHGQCRGCRVRVLAGSLPITPHDRDRLSAPELADGWRLACRATAEGDLTLEIAQWEAAVLGDDTPFDFKPEPGLGIAVDLGTTTLVAQLLDLETGDVLAVRTGLNPQARHGADLMSRIHFALEPSGERTLRTVVRAEIGRMVAELIAAVSPDRGPLQRVVIVGNTAMHHIFCGVSIAPLSQYPFEPTRDGLETFTASDLGWSLGSDPEIRFLPCLGGFVGSDVLAGVLAVGLDRMTSASALVDLGTNGEIVLAAGGRLACASTAAGPAFEGARISQGMRAATGAISEVERDGSDFEIGVLGGGEPSGICGSGLVDAVAAGLDAGTILTTGRFASGDSRWVLHEPVAITQRDIRELQLAKGAIAAGIRLLALGAGVAVADLERFWLAGAFGNSIRRASARRIGLLELPPRRIRPAGNTALRGAKIALFSRGDDDLAARIARIRERCKHVPLASDSRFHDVYVDSMPFPPASA